MARAPAGLPAGLRLTDHISLGVIAKAFLSTGLEVSAVWGLQ